MANKTKLIWFCKECGSESSKWMGKCNACGAWNSLVEELVFKGPSKVASILPVQQSKPLKLKEIEVNLQERISTGFSEFDRVLGGGFVPGSIILLGGEPGIGKSTLALQTAVTIQDKLTLYVSGEESASQIKLRAERIHGSNDSCLILCETCLENIVSHVNTIMPGIIVIDSIQTLYSQNIEATPGSISQIKECAAQLLKLAKTLNIPTLLIGHITKDGTIAGPKILEHIVDAVLQFEGDQHHLYRILRSAKNRFGSTNEMGIFEMNDAGLKEIKNPSDILINQFNQHLCGVSIAASVNGMRPFLIEIQALVSTAVYGTPQRSATGFDIKRLNMLLAVLEKRAGFKLNAKDVFLNIAGGIRVDDPAIDLSVVASILSSNFDISVNNLYGFAGEIGLSGEVRPVSRLEQRISEAEKFGLSKIFVSEFARKSLHSKKFKIQIVYIAKVEELVKAIFSQNNNNEG